MMPPKLLSKRKNKGTPGSGSDPKSRRWVRYPWVYFSLAAPRRLTLWYWTAHRVSFLAGYNPLLFPHTRIVMANPVLVTRFSRLYFKSEYSEVKQASQSFRIYVLAHSSVLLAAYLHRLRPVICIIRLHSIGIASNFSRDSRLRF